jgi:hypothetical protein
VWIIGMTGKAAHIDQAAEKINNDANAMVDAK